MRLLGVCIGFLCLCLSSCNEGGLYGTVNPPLNGVVIGGSGNQNVSGFVRVSPDPLSPTCKSSSDCFLTISNRSFITLQTTVPMGFLRQPHKKLGISIASAKNHVVYVYKRNGSHLERDNMEYQGGVFPSGTEYNLSSLRNENYQDILARGIFSLKKLAHKPENAILGYLSLKAPVPVGEVLSVCLSTIDEQTNQVEAFLNKPADCFTVKL